MMSKEYRTPTSETPTDEEIEQWQLDCCDATRKGKAEHYWSFEVQMHDGCDIVRAALDKWGKPQNVDPIPLSERKPGPEDCSESNLCWFWLPDEHEGLGQWQLQHRDWATDPDTDYTHSQPFHAISRPS